MQKVKISNFARLYFPYFPVAARSLDERYCTYRCIALHSDLFFIRKIYILEFRIYIYTQCFPAGAAVLRNLWPGVLPPVRGGEPRHWHGGEGSCQHRQHQQQQGRQQQQPQQRGELHELLQRVRVRPHRHPTLRGQEEDVRDRHLQGQRMFNKGETTQTHSLVLEMKDEGDEPWSDDQLSRQWITFS